jgi:hypothetical protein
VAHSLIHTAWSAGPGSAPFGECCDRLALEFKAKRQVLDRHLKGLMVLVQRGACWRLFFCCESAATSAETLREKAGLVRYRLLSLKTFQQGPAPHAARRGLW